MSSRVNPGAHVEATVDRALGLSNTATHIGTFHIDICGPDGKVRESHVLRNKLTTQGVTYMLNRMFFVETAQRFAAVNSAGANGAGWYLGLIETTPTLVDADTVNSTLLGAGWSDFANYDETAKQQYDSELVEVESTAPARTISNGTQISIAINAGTNVPVGGVYCINRQNGSYNGTTDIILSTARFATEPTVSNGDTLKVTYTHTIGASTDT